MKRAVDISLASSALVATLPIIAMTDGLVRLTMGAPVLFLQRRPGRFGVPFTLVKFRTMTSEPSTSIEDDAWRVTRLGRLLRTTSIDELPQLWNVLKGEMSIVGPRPLMMQ